MSHRLIAGGIIGGAIAALCCFTPVLVVLFGAVGLSAWLGWADYVLMPALLFFVLLTGYAIYRRRRNPDAACETASAPGSKKSGA
ncbi:mercury resistance system transport protein MerF [Bosea sp. (in: a-proteobacteria)]|uniref:mercury resistance system transport protein MerF n=1 Tax=Bosea sp. (in: a-proteobacteria) TaxID=1871050 RepID=UPI0012156296|nr:mercury resistance system transport protein MerF [Bosea sp. (in: a-proteobacteria)]TAJ33928.1 MAG: mercury resistance system transport protein MerF [Bosea sp. (in: a-proteobacteria)]